MINLSEKDKFEEVIQNWVVSSKNLESILGLIYRKHVVDLINYQNTDLLACL